MARAKCTKCGEIQYWYAGRGRKLSDIKSKCCDVPLEGMTTGKSNPNKGRKYIVCGVCGARRLLDNLYKPTVDFTVFGWKYDGKIFPKGTIACQWHSFVPVGKV